MKRDGCWPGSSDKASESGGSSEEIESPKSVVAVGEEYVSYWPRLPKGGWLVHNQVLRIKDEDFHMGEDNNMLAMMSQPGARNICVVLMARQVLPHSTLGGRAITAATTL